MPFTKLSSCPQCGAPIFAKLDIPDSLVFEDVPTPVYTCTCRFVIHGQLVPFVQTPPAGSPGGRDGECWWHVAGHGASL